MSPAKNLLVMQSGGPTPVINRSLFGVCDEASKSGAFTGILGAQRGVEGVLGNRVFDLASVSTEAWQSMAIAPGAALGTTRKKLADADLIQVIKFIERRGITHWLIIGGNDSASTALTVGAAAKDAGLDLTVLLVPKTVDNDLVGTDHSPGYGSAARFVASATQGAGRDAEAMGPRRADNRDRGRGASLRVAGSRVRAWQTRAARRAPRGRHAGNTIRSITSPVEDRE